MVTIATVNSTNYNEATPVTFTLHVTKANQTITAPSSPTGPSTSVLSVATTASSGLPVAYTLGAGSTATGCGVNGSGVVSATSAGTCVIDLNQSGNANYSAAAQVVVTATFTSIGSTVTFNGNGNTGGATASENFPTSTAQALTLNGFTRTGYTFVGWNTAADGSGTEYSDQQSISVTTNETLYAQWALTNPIVTFNGNGNTGGATASETFTHGLPQSLTLNGFTRTGYTFVGWNTAANGSGTEYSDQQSITVSTNETLYAQWIQSTFTVTFNGNGSTGGATANETFTLGSYQALTLNGFTRTGYTFSGWNTASNGSGISYSNQQTISITSSVTLYAQWTANPVTVTVTFNGNGNTGGSMPNESFTSGVGKALSANGFTRTGYTFTGWNTQANGSGIAYGAGATITITANTTLYAQWTANTYAVTFNGNGSTSGSMSNETFTYGVAKALSTNGFSRTGYTFTGWNTQANGSGTAYGAGATITITANTTLFAQWTANTYTVSFNGNGSTSGSMSNETFTYGVAKTLTSNGFTRTNYTFVGWGTVAGGPVVYANGQSISITANVSLYAQWTPVITLSSTSLSLNVSTRTYGDEDDVVYTVNVSSTSGTPTGSVAIKSGATTLCTITLHNGSGSLHLRLHEHERRCAVHHGGLLR